MCLNVGHLLDFVRVTWGNLGGSSIERRYVSGFTYRQFLTNMSKRSNKPKQPSVQAQQQAQFQIANRTMHNVNVSTPILVVIQRLANDKVFANKVAKLL